ncbi:helix-turn-helix transcriptional regulator [Variovorax sp. J22R24]|uniref:helix-turn-helix transcriptional regulator n=1 Tax=Variovorax gracilis TaxID=3053502 RepID=UPI0025773EB1|nr:helix-turn-helix transcriptional regulator [Variovorax sp. J22R24]MDM0109256.1 helix-turn-helix transcriptional regulator [Variovorax sp. J22R24]
MQLVRLSEQAPARTLDRSWQASQAIAGVVGCVGDREFGTAALKLLNAALPLCWWSVYTLFDGRPPEMYVGGSYEVADRTRDAFQFYRRGVYLADRTFDSAREYAVSGGAVLTHWRAEEIPRRHRGEIYTRHELKERASVVTVNDAGCLTAINLYRHERQRSFDDSELELLSLLGTPLAACVGLHLRNTGLQHPVAQRPDADTAVAPARGSSILGALPKREREVCERLLKGWTYEGVAADLAISSGTVKTYRDRAFERLGIHHRNELFALAIGSLG